MVGHCTDRFEQLDDNQRLKQELLCGICRQVIADAIQTQCKHNFCYDCLKTYLSSSSVISIKVCPNCRQSLITRKRKKKRKSLSVNNNNSNVLEIMPNIWVERNGKLNNIIGSLKARCDYHWNGCPVAMELDTIDSHHSLCEHRRCRRCDQLLVVGQRHDGDHNNCVDALKEQLAFITNKCDTIVTEKSELNEFFGQTYTRIQKQIQELSASCRQFRATDDDNDNNLKTAVTVCQTVYRKFTEEKQRLKSMESSLRSLLLPPVVGDINDSMHCCLVCDQSIASSDRPLVVCSNIDCSNKFHMSCIGFDRIPNDYMCPNCLINSTNRYLQRQLQPNNSSTIKRFFFHPCIGFAPIRLRQILFGTVRFTTATIKFNETNFILFCVGREGKGVGAGSSSSVMDVVVDNNNKSSYHLTIPYNHIQKMMTSIIDKTLVILISKFANNKVNNCLGFNNNNNITNDSTKRFDTDSDDIRERYVFIQFEDSSECMFKFLDTIECDGQRVCHPINDHILGYL
ncbi:uncharacterized protein LOC128956968 [Oppia nitens]|uniref:uncharacterized protein LOC128956968 n=1 Tax=Oppia nitens TaxID=1686743 RepID=UPI0023DB574A|nr:uncharacterized protein LOC128956968 [Oppia nitens]